MFDLAREIGQTLSNNKLRTSLTGLSVAWGIFMLIILLGMSQGVVNSFNEGFMSQGSNYINIWGGRTSNAFKGYKEGRSIDLKESDLNVIDSRNGNIVDNISSSISGSSVVISSPIDYISSGYDGVFPDELDKRGIPLSYGRFINELDLEHRRKVVVLTEQNAAILFKTAENAIGKQVKMKDLSFTVIGVINPRFGQETYIPFTTALALKGGDSVVDGISVELKNVYTMEDGEKAEGDIKKTLAHTHDFDTEDNGAVHIWNRFNQHLTMSSALNVLQLVVWLIGLFTLLSGIIGVSNIMFVSVKERTHEIGIRRAIGAKPMSILIQIITESVAITGIFGYIGVFFGIVIIEFLGKIFEGSEFIGDVTVDISIAIKVTIVLIIAGCLAGLFPALKALKVKPVEALRDE
ncbi:MAG: ABC transporter permease [Muribaculaceae bacterium]|nr:ABC transporter permease [Muribaculaceae bacterium]